MMCDMLLGKTTVLELQASRLRVFTLGANIEVSQFTKVDHRGIRIELYLAFVYLAFVVYDTRHVENDDDNR